MEENENQNPVQSSDNFNFSDNGGNGKKKKSMGPVKGLFVAIVIAVLIILLGLLIRMIIAGDNDYFKPIKDIFGIKDEEKTKAPNKVESITNNESNNFISAERYSLLISDVDNKDVKHYRMTLNLKEFFQNLYDEMQDSTNYNDYDSDYEDDSQDEDSLFDKTMSLRMIDEDYDDSEDDTYYDDEDDFYYDDSDDSYYDDDDDFYYDDENDLSDDEIYSDDRFRSSLDSEDDYGTDYIDPEDDMGGKIENFISQFSSMMSMMGDQIEDLIGGEMYYDIYFEGNEIVQVVLGVDYGDVISNVYDYIIENSSDEEIEEMENEGVYSPEDLADYIVDKFNEGFDMDEMLDDDSVKENLSEYDLTKQDIKSALNIHLDRGIAEIYLTGTGKVNELLNEYFDSYEFKQNFIDVDTGENIIDIDEDNIIEDLINYSNENEENQNYGMEFVEIN